jgi:large subunit ribosomal protein L15
VKNLNNIKPNQGATQSAKRVGRGIGSGLGKTCGRGHKGQKSRSGGFHKLGFEGGQMPVQRRLPKFGFTSRVASKFSEVRTSELKLIEGDLVDIASLKNARIINRSIETAKIILSGDCVKAFTVKGVRVTKGAKQAIENAGGKVED